jgi:ferrous iron transport protein A
MRIWQRAGMTLDAFPSRRFARITAIDWSLLAPEEATRLRALGFDTGVKVEIAHRGVFAGKDPLAITIGRMTVALRRAHARAMSVEEA